MKHFSFLFVVLLLLNNAINFTSAIPDTTAPDVSISTPPGVQNGAFDVSVTFTEIVSDFEHNELVLTGTATASITSFTTTDNTTYTATITPTTSGDVTFNIAAGVATDAANNSNIAATEKTVSVSVDTTVEIPDSNLAAALRNAFSLDTGTSITKSQMESLTTFTYRADQLSSTRRVYDLTGIEYATNLQMLNLRGNAISDTMPLTNLRHLTELILSGNRINSISVIKGLTNLQKLYLTSNYISDISGLEDLTALTELHIKKNPILDIAENRQTRSILETRPGLTLKIAAFRINDNRPGVEIFVPTGTHNAAFQVTISFTEVVSGFEEVDIILGGGATATVASLSTTDNIIYTAEITPTADGNVTLNIAPGIATDAANNPNTAATQKTVTVNVPPQVSLSVPSGTQDSAFDVSVIFTEVVSDFEEIDLVLSGSATASITSFTTTDNITYTATITPTTDGDVIFNVAAGVATDSRNNANTAATQKTVTISLETTDSVDIVIEIPDATLALIIRDRLSLGAETIITKSQMESLTYISRGGGNFRKSERVRDLTGLEYATNLQSLNLISHRITDITVLEKLTNLTKLDIRNNMSSDITVLKNLTNLTQLNLRKNGITDVNALAGLTGLTRLNLRGNTILDTSPLYPLLKSNGGNLSIDIEVSEYPPWDVNKDGSVDDADSALVTAAIGQMGDNVANARTDVDGDGDVDADDLLLVTDNIAEPAASSAAPSVNGNILIQLDAAALETLDRDILQAQLSILRAENNGSAKYLRAIALIENVLAATRPEKTQILPNYPNPFNPETWIPYHLANASNVQITIYDVHGTVVRRLDLGHQRDGYYTNRSRAAYWDGRNAFGERVASGIYFYQLEADNLSLLRKMVILK